MSWGKFKEIGNRVEDWWQDHELFVGLMTLTLVVLYMLFTEDGNRMRATSVGAIVFWSLVVLIGLSIVNFLLVSGWLYHIFMLCLIAYFVFSEGTGKTWLWVSVFYVASILVPRFWRAFWQVFSNELAEKIASKLEDRLKNQERRP